MTKYGISWSHGQEESSCQYQDPALNKLRDDELY